MTGGLQTQESHRWVSWSQLALSLAVYAGGLVWLLSASQSAEMNLRGAVDNLSRQVEKMGEQVGRLATSNERMDEHMKSVDRRLDILEKDKSIEGWKRN
jgi:hypothetical protein